MQENLVLVVPVGWCQLCWGYTVIMLDIFQTGVISINYVVKVVFGNQSDYHYNQSNTQPSILPLALLPSPSRTHAHAHTHTHTCTHTDTYTQSVLFCYCCFERELVKQCNNQWQCIWLIVFCFVFYPTDCWFCSSICWFQPVKYQKLPVNMNLGYVMNC